MNLKAIALGSLGLLFLACGTDSDEEIRFIKGGDYTNKAIGLTITFPPAWVIKTDQKFGDVKVDMIATGLPIKEFKPNLSVIFGAHAGPTLVEAFPTFQSELASRIPDMSRYQDTLYVMNGIDVAEIEYESTVSGNLFHFLQMFYTKNGQDVTCSITDRADDFADNAEIKGIKASIQIK
jgi:hypothetical protein